MFRIKNDFSTLRQLRTTQQLNLLFFSGIIQGIIFQKACSDPVKEVVHHAQKHISTGKLKILITSPIACIKGVLE
jgi:DNA primase